MNLYLKVVERYAVQILILIFSVTAFFIYTLSDLKSDTNPYLLKESHPARKTMIDFQSEFTGTYDSVMIAFYNPNGIFNTKTLDALYEISKKARQVVLVDQSDISFLNSLKTKYKNDSSFINLLDEILIDSVNQNDYLNLVKLRDYAKSSGFNISDLKKLIFIAERSNPIKEMASIADFENITLSEDGVLTIHKSLRDKGMDPEIVRNEIVNNELMLGGVVSRDETVALLVAELGTKQDDAEAQLRAYRIFQSIVAEYKKQNPEFKDSTYIGGMPIFIAAQEEIIDHDMGLLFPIVFIIISLLLVLIFRKPLGLFLPILNIFMCTIWTLGLMAIFDVPIDLLTSVLPVFIFTICSADAIHFIAEYYEQKKSVSSNNLAVVNTINLMAAPIVLTTITTVATFLISTLTNIESIRNFGIFMSVGLVTALIISLLLLPSWLFLFGKQVSDRNTSSDITISGKILFVFAKTLIDNRKPGIIVLVAVLVYAGFLSTKVQIEDSGIAYFEIDSDVRVADEFINAHVAGTAPGWISIDSGRPRGALDLETVQFIDDLDTYIKSLPQINYGYSLATYIKRMNLVLNNMVTEYSRIPHEFDYVTYINDDYQVERVDVSGQDLIEQHIMLFENSGGSDLTNVLNSDYSKAVTLFTMTSTVASDYRDVMKKIDEWVVANKPEGVVVTYAGTPVIWTGVLEEITKGQLVSLTLASLVVTLMMMLWFRSWKLGLLCMLPLIFSDVFVYAFMYVLGIELNIGTVLVTFLVIGIVDYTAHFVLRIRNYILLGNSIDNSILNSVQSIGKSILFNVVIFSSGFLALFFSQYQPIIDLGLLVALALFTSGIMTFIVIILFSPFFFKNYRLEYDAYRIPVNDEEPKAAMIIS